MAALALLVACSGGGQEGGPSGPPPPVVETTVVQPELVLDEVELVGQLETTYSVVLKPEISGVIEAITFEESTFVKKGDPLVRLRDGEQRARLHMAQAELALKKAVYGRAQKLAKRDAQSAAELERARAEYEIARAQVELAEVELARTVIKAPFDGILGARLVSPGERVSPGGDRGPDGGGSQSTGLVRIDALDEMELVFTIPETVIALVKNGVDVSLRVAPYPNETFDGSVYFVSPRVDATNRRVLVKARVPNPEHKLRPGLFAKLDVVVDRRENALMVPEDAVLYSQDGTYVWRLDEQGLPERAPVELGIRQPGRVEARTGLRPGDRIVASGTHKVMPGMPVQSAEVPAGGTGEPDDVRRAEAAGGSDS